MLTATFEAQLHARLKRFRQGRDVMFVPTTKTEAKWPPFLFAPSDRHAPRRRGIQYAAAFPIKHYRLWNTGSSAFADDDSGPCNPLLTPAARPHARAGCRRGPSPR